MTAARLGHTIGVIARLDRAIQYSEAAMIEPMGCGILDAPPARGMTVVVGLLARKPRL